MTTSPLRRQRGLTLIEAMVGFLVLSLGLLGALRLQSWLRLNGDIARQRTEAVQLAQQDVEQMRAFANATAFNSITHQRSETSGSRTTFALARTVSTNGALKNGLVAVSWQDRSGAAQSVQLHAAIAGLAPVYSAALTLPAQDTTLAPRRDLPVGAKYLAHGRSVFKPTARSSVAWVVNDASGEVVAQCIVPSSLAAQAITEADLTQCNNVVGRLMHGYIRFADDRPIALTILLSATRCETEAWSEGRERYLAYSCLAPPRSGAADLRIVPDGWAFGDNAGTFKACRHTGRASVQNFLLIRGDTACPGTLAPHNDVSTATVQHQP